uniref:Uncharacterized protein n=1 Tax=Siphoviridae sp. ct96x5 TaxID=2825367 RepID=A0A8S5PRH1_9CAUD|nr:MAG TPA: hypothetical protein [Siphoviridae sp. ct96x5]
MNLTLSDMLRVASGLPKVKKDVRLTVFDKEIISMAVTKYDDDGWYVDMRTEETNDKNL